MIRLFNVYYPVRTLILPVGEALAVWMSFLLAIVARRGWSDGYLVLNYEGGYYQIAGVTVVVLMCSYWFDLYNASRFESPGELYFRLLLVPGILSVLLAGLSFWFPERAIHSGVYLFGIILLTFALLGWRAMYAWLVRREYLWERVYVLGCDDKSKQLIEGLRRRSELGMHVVGWTGDLTSPITRESLAEHLTESCRNNRVHRVIVALRDRRDMMPVRELLQLRLQGVKIEEAASWLEKMKGKIEVDQMLPSWLVFSEGFRRNTALMLLRRLLSHTLSLVLLIVVLPLIPLVMLAIKLDSRGPMLYRQKRVGYRGTIFHCYKFRTMRQDAEADTGPTWADDDDPRITRVGKFLRLSRLDEIPQLWNVFRGDMAFVGPRPERPEFVEWLTKEVPYYPVRHVIRPGITGWAQVRYRYGSTVEDAREKLQFDLYYIKNVSLGLDLVVVFQTVKIVLLGRGAR